MVPAEKSMMIENGREFSLWRMTLNWSQIEAADALGISISSIIGYEAGDPIPRVVGLACEALSNQNKDMLAFYEDFERLNRYFSLTEVVAPANHHEALMNFVNTHFKHPVHTDTFKYADYIWLEEICGEFTQTFNCYSNDAESMTVQMNTKICTTIDSINGEICVTLYFAENADALIAKMRLQ